MNFTYFHVICTIAGSFGCVYSHGWLNREHDIDCLHSILFQPSVTWSHSTCLSSTCSCGSASALCLGSSATATSSLGKVRHASRTSSVSQYFLLSFWWSRVPQNCNVSFDHFQFLASLNIFSPLKVMCSSNVIRLWLSYLICPWDLVNLELIIHWLLDNLTRIL